MPLSCTWCTMANSEVPMVVVESVVDLIGKTPLLRLQELEDGGAEIWAKLETANPGGSVKDRIGLGMILAAEEEGRLQPGGTIVEATAGNTGIGLALVGTRRGYRVILVVPEKYSVEKQKLMRALGAELIITPTEQGMAGAQARAEELAQAIPGALYINQFANQANPRTHELTTGPEIAEQTQGRLDAIVIGCGSGGTFTGVARYLKKHFPHVWAVAVEPQGSVLGGGQPGEHAVEGIGMDTIYPVVDVSLADEIMTIPDPEAFSMVRRLARECGVLAGSSAGANVAAAVRVSRRLGPGKRVVTVIPDSCERYLSKDILNLFPEAL